MTRDRSRSPVWGAADDRRRNGQPHPDRGGRFDPHSDKMVYITNLPYDMTWMDLKDVIRNRGGEVSFVEIMKTKEGKSKGVAVVEFATKDSALKTIETLHREEVHGRVISAKEIRDPQAFFRRIKEESGIDFLARDRRDRPPPQRRPSPARGSNETYGLSASFLDSLNLKPPLVNRVFVTNISYSCGVGKLFDVFSMAGKITWLDLQLDKDGKTKGMAIVEYSHPIEAVQAISMLSNQRLFDRTITVKMDRFEKELDRDRQGLPNGLRGVGMGLGANGSPLSDIASVIGQIGGGIGSQPAPVQPFQSNGSSMAPPLQPVQPQSFAGYQSNPAPTSQVFDNNPYNSQAPRQVSPAAFFGQQPQTAFNEQYSKSNSFTPYDRKPSSLIPSGFSGSTQPRSAQGSYVTSYDVPTRIILIKNLPHDYTWDVIAQRVRQFGDFESVELVSSGVAKVRFLHVQDAERAKATLNSTVVENNMIAVEYILQ